MPDLELVAGTLASPYECYQPLYEQMMGRGHAVASAVTGILIQDAVPDPADQDKGWIPTSGGVPRYAGYTFVWHAVLGHWVARHEIAADDIKRYPTPYPDTLVNFNTYLQTYDGGDAGAVGPASGPMWEVDPQFEGSVPIGVGLIPGSSPATSIVEGGDTSDSLGGTGEYEHVLTGAEGAVADHAHPVGLFNPSGGTGDDAFFNWAAAPITVPNYTGKYIQGGGGPITSPETTADIYTLKAADGAGVVSDPHNNMQPYLGVYFLKRTARIWIVAA